MHPCRTRFFISSLPDKAPSISQKSFTMKICCGEQKIGKRKIPS